MIAVRLLALLLLPVLPVLDGEREALWNEFERLRSGAVTGLEAEQLLERLGTAAEELESGPQTDLLRLCLANLAGADIESAAARLAALAPEPFSVREAWFLLDAMPEGAHRSSRLLQALDRTPELGRWQLLLAWNVGVDDARSLRLEDGALPIQERLHQRYRAEWSALDLLLTLRKLGRREAVERLFDETMQAAGPSGPSAAELWSQRGISTAGFGDDRRARDYLGKALAQGSEDAGLVLGRMDLVAGHIEAARAGFRASILNLPPPDWSWRGWGTTLLPRAFESPAPAGAPSPSTLPTSR